MLLTILWPPLLPSKRTINPIQPIKQEQKPFGANGSVSFNKTEKEHRD